MNHQKGDEIMICDKCKTEVSPDAKFCQKCGSKVEAVQPAEAQGSAEGVAAQSEIKQAEAPPANAQSQMAQQGGRKTSKDLLVVVILILLVVAGSAGYLYYAGFVGKSPAKLGEQINNELKGKGLNLYCEIDKNWTATLKGAVKSPAEKETAMSIVKSHKEVKDVKDELQPQVSPSDLALAIDNALLVAGLMDIRADVDENLVATLKGIAASESEKANAVSLAKAVEKVKDVKDNIQVQAAEPPAETAPQPPLPAEQPRQKKRDTARPPKGSYGDEKQRPGAASLDPFELEVKINRALQRAGLTRVRARVGEHLNARLQGSVATEEERTKAIGIAESFKGIREVRDRIIVAGY